MYLESKAEEALGFEKCFSLSIHSSSKNVSFSQNLKEEMMNRKEWQQAMRALE